MRFVSILNLLEFLFVLHPCFFHTVVPLRELKEQGSLTVSTEAMLTPGL